MQVYFLPLFRKRQNTGCHYCRCALRHGGNGSKASLPAGKSSCFLIYLKDLDHEEHLIRLWS